jgi:hypothetical protein
MPSYLSRTAARSIEPLEARIAPSVSSLSVLRALDLPDGITLTLNGDPAAFAVLALGGTGQLLGFPSGGDGDFLILSTGIASQVTSLANTGTDQGTDLGPVGADGDTATVSFTLPVPISSSPQRLKLDFVYLTEEFPEFVGQGFNDSFTVKINGVNYATDELGNPIEVDNAFFTGEPATGTFFDGRTNKLTLTYVVPDGVTELNVELQIKDSVDGVIDSAVIVDNVRFETPQVVYLDLDGGTIANHFGPGITASLPGFLPADIGSTESVDALIASLVAKLESKFSLYDIVFTTSQPTNGDFTTLLIGGDNSTLLDISGASPLVKNRFPGINQVPLRDVFNLGPDSLLGLSGTPDVGNLDRNDRSVIFSGEFDNFFANASPESRLDQLAVTISHELGHNLGLRHVSDSASGDIMSETDPRDPGSVFTNELHNLSEEWSDGVTNQNSHIYLLSILGKESGSGLSTAVAQGNLYFAPQPGKTFYNVTLTIDTPDPHDAPIQLFFNQLNGSQNIALPILGTGSKIHFSAASTLGGPIDIFSGVPTAGNLTDDASAVPLFGAGGTLLNVPLAKFANGKYTPTSSMPLLRNQLGEVNVVPQKSITLVDSDGDIYTIKLKGGGLLGYVQDDPDQDGRGGLSLISIDGTTVGKSDLSVSVKKAKTGDGRVNVGDILGSIGAGLRSLSASSVNLTATGLVLSGALGSATLHDLTNGADITTGLSDSVKSTLKFHVIGAGSDLSIGTDVSLLLAAQIGDATLTLPSLSKIIVSGDRSAAIAASFAGQLSVDGLLKSFTAGDILGTADIHSKGTALDGTTIKVHEIKDGASISLKSALSSLKAARIGDAEISAHTFESISVTGDSRAGIKGDIAGDFVAIGKLGKLTAHDLLTGASIQAGGFVFDKTNILVHEIKSGVEIVLESAIGTLKAVNIGGATIEAASLASLLVTGSVKESISGGFAARLKLIGGDELYNNTLTTAVIAGGVQNATISVDSIGNFTAAGVQDSVIYAGYSPEISATSFGGGVFFEGSAIKSLKLTSAIGALANTIIAAKQFGSILINSLTTNNGGDEFGILTDTVPTKMAIIGFVYDKLGASDQFVGDFHFKVI